MVPELKHNRRLARFEVWVDGQLAGFAHYRRYRKGVASFDHTEISEAYGGQGLASAVVEFGLSRAREEGWKVRPVCPFVVSYLKRHPEHADLVA